MSFHVKPEEVWERAAHWAGLRLDSTRIGVLQRYRSWLLEEAVPAGALGPHEPARVDLRHIADSIVFAGPLPPAPDRVLDVGAGAGLPGVPLAILMPDTEFHLLDRSGRRVDLLRRAVRILELGNVTVEMGDVTGWKDPVPGIVSRASLSPEQAHAVFSRILTPGGTAVLGGSWARRPEVIGFQACPIPEGVLDHEVWLLIMRRK